MVWYFMQDMTQLEKKLDIKEFMFKLFICKKITRGTPHTLISYTNFYIL